MKHLMLLVLIPLAGCAHQSFNIDPATLREGLARHMADRFTTDDTLIIDAPFRHPMALLGVAAVDRVAGTFELVGLNHMGVQVFHLSGDREGVHVKAAIPPLMEQKRILLSIAQDSRNMYFDLLPAENSTVKQRAKGLRFSSKVGRGAKAGGLQSAGFERGTLIHDFTGVDLVEKRLKGLIFTKWRIRYSDYKEESGKLHPGRIVLDNGRYFYTMSVKNRQFQVK